MVIAIIIAMIVLLILLIVVINRESRTPTPEPKTKPEPKPQPIPGPEQSLDALYAEKNGLWVCSHCETLNQKSAQRCVACGEEE